MGRRHLNIALMRRRRAAQAAALSGARTLVRFEDEALSLDFTDNYFYSTTSLYGSAYVKDTGTPANNYDSTPYGLLTYTSPSAKMTRGPDGLLRFGAHNLYLNSASPANQSITVVSGATYSVDITGSVSVTASGAATGTWTAGSNTFTAATTTLTLGSTSGSGTVSVRRTPSDTTYLATTSAARYALPYEWDASGNLHGILVEEARTNLHLRAEEFDNASWIQGSAMSVTANSISSPTGETTADLLTATVTGTNGFVRQTNTLAATTTYTISTYVKKGSVDYFNITVYDNTDGNRYWFNVNTGAVASTAVVGAGLTSPSASISSVGSGWYRCSVTFTSKAATGFSSFFAFTDADASLTLTSGATGYLWGSQLEAGSFPTSYIPTIDSTATRATDNISLATSRFALGAERSVYVKFRYSSDTFLSNWIVQLEDDTTNNRDFIFCNGVPITARVVNGGVLVANVNSGSAAFGGTYKTAYALANNDFAMTTDGGAVQTDTSVAVPAATRLLLGLSTGLPFSFTGHIQSLLIIPRRISNADLQTLTGTGVLPP